MEPEGPRRRYAQRLGHRCCELLGRADLPVGGTLCEHMVREGLVGKLDLAQLPRPALGNAPHIEAAGKQRGIEEAVARGHGGNT